jgi:PAS domain S-box-containing protein
MEMTKRTPAAVPTPRRSRFRGNTWFILYVALAVLDLGAVTYTLYQHYRISEMLERRAMLDESFEKQTRIIRTLNSIATKIDDIANADDTPKSRAELQEARKSMALALAALRRSVPTTPGYGPLMQARIERIDHNMNEIGAAGEEKLTAAAHRDLAAGTVANARIDRASVVVGALLDELSGSIDAIQDRLFSEQHAEARLIHRAQFLIAVLILAIVAGMAIYGRALAKQVLSARERERYVDELRESNEAFEQLLRKNELILNAAADGIFGLDLRGALTFLNPAAEAMIGFSLEEMHGRTVHETVHHSHADGTPYPIDGCPSYRALHDGTAATVTDDTFWRKDGTSFSAEYSVTPMRDEDGQTVGAVVMFRDTTERRAVQRLKDEFVSLVSHELRTPLTSIRGALGLLAGGLLAKSPEKGQRMLDIAVSNTDRLVRLINDILDIERMESARVQLSKTRCDPAVLLQDSVELMRPMAERAGVQIALLAGNDTTAVWADADRIAQTITNLLSNAIKFSPAGSTITVSASRGREGVVFRVADQGRGIPREKLESVFERFQQVDASDSRDKGGSGLGLTICRSIVRQHGGELRVESVVGKGSVFSFSLPSAAPQLETESPARGARVIVCDDEADVRETLQVMLQQHGYYVRTANGGEELLRMARSFRPEVILLDLFMPVMGGWHTMAALRGDPETAGIPVVILSGLSEDEAPSHFDLAGWVQKPLDEGTLLGTLEHALGLTSRKARLMLVEDDFDLARVIVASFDRHGIDTCHASTGREAIEMMRAVAPDILILDLTLPEVDGFGVVQWMAGQKHLRNTPLIVYSAGDPTPAEREALRLGPTQFLTKSRVPPEEFEMRVVQLLDVLTLTKEGEGDAA